MAKFKTEQEKFWAGKFGTDYISRNRSDEYLASNIGFFSKALAKTNGLKSCIEFGANIGMNLKAIKHLFPNVLLKGIEINPDAADTLGEFLGEKNVYRGSILDYSIKNDKEKCDLALIKTVLIHINPESLDTVYDKLHKASRKYILVCEYYNQVPVTISYRGHSNKLFKRDFAGDLLDRFKDLKLIDYGFSYQRDTAFPQDDITWFLLSK
jgi:spore coat polysaccharide biosynthesis protein SpsF